MHVFIQSFYARAKGHGEYCKPQGAQRELFRISPCTPWSAVFAVAFSMPRFSYFVTEQVNQKITSKAIVNL